MALANLRISQIALNLADNASRVGAATALSTVQLREVDLNDVLQAARYQGKAINLTGQGRITLSSLENVQQTYDTAPVQRIHWQRCLGLKSGTGYDMASQHQTTSTAGTDATAANAGTAAPTGMGDPGTTPVSAPAASGLMYVEMNYEYKPLVSGWLLSSSKRIHYVASFIVRDNRDFSKVFNPSPTATKSICNLYSS